MWCLNPFAKNNPTWNHKITFQAPSLCLAFHDSILQVTKCNNRFLKETGVWMEPESIEMFVCHGKWSPIILLFGTLCWENIWSLDKICHRAQSPIFCPSFLSLESRRPNPLSDHAIMSWPCVHMWAFMPRHLLWLLTRSGGRWGSRQNYGYSRRTWKCCWHT